MRPIHRFVAVMAGLLCASSLAHAADSVYPINMHRAFKAGDTYDSHTVIDVSTKESMTPPNAPAQSEEKAIKAEIISRISVATVDRKGDPDNFTLTVTKFTAGPDAKDAVAAGKVITIKRSETEVTATLPDGEDLSPEALEAIKAAYHPVTKSDVTDDDIFGSGKPRAVGESWDLNAENAAKAAAGEHLTIDPKDISGKVTLKGVEKANGAAALRLAADMEAKSLQPVGLAPGVTIEDSHLKAHFEGLYPVDAALPAAENHMVMDTSLRASANGGKFEAVTHVDVKETITPVAK